MNVVYSFLTSVFIMFLILWILKKRTRKTLNISGKHVLVTGGSSGIGKWVAISAAKNGANVTIIARDKERLGTAYSEIQEHCKNRNQRVFYISLDITKNYSAIEDAISEAESIMGPVVMLVNCAGMALCGKLEDMSIDDAYQLVNLNYLGTLHVTKAVVKRMKERKCGSIVITASLAAVVGIFGYTVYSSTKYALRGLAEALHMEVKSYNITVTLALPPDTDTPGFANEEKSKPVETRLISEAGGLHKPQIVAEKIFQDALIGKFFSTIGFDGYMLSTMSAGMSPVSSFLDLTLQVLLMGALRLVGACYLSYFHRIIQKCTDQQT